MAQVSSIKNTSFPINNSKWNNSGYKAGDFYSAQGNSGISDFASIFYSEEVQVGHKYDINCKWEPFREQILAQWPNLTKAEVDTAGPNRSYLAMLISAKYGVDMQIIKNYLRNFERILPAV